MPGARLQPHLHRRLLANAPTWISRQFCPEKGTPIDLVGARRLVPFSFRSFNISPTTHGTQATYSHKEHLLIRKPPHSPQGSSLAAIPRSKVLEPHLEHIQSNLIHGFDFDVTMLRIAAMNLLLHGIDAPDIHYQDTLSSNFPDKFPRHAQNFFDVILANPPFKGSLDFEDVHSSLLAQVKTKKTELLFVALILRMLKNGGRSATIVPDGVLFGSSKAHVALREMLVERNQLEAVISLPSGVFRPYAGVSTGILIFTKGGKTEDVFFYDMQDDGFSLDDKRTQLYDSNFAGDLPGCLASWNEWQKSKLDSTPTLKPIPTPALPLKGRELVSLSTINGDITSASSSPFKGEVRRGMGSTEVSSGMGFTDRTAKAFSVPAQEIRDKNYDLSLNRFKETVYEDVKHVPPKEILQMLKGLESEIMQDLVELEGMLG